jgi:hypothetical protein
VSDKNCPSGLLCAYGRCRQPCRSDRDCAIGAVCVPLLRDPTVYVCTLPDEGGGQGCPEQLSPAPDGFCRLPCQGSGADPRCGPSQTCDEQWCRPLPEVDGGAGGGGDGGGGDGALDGSSAGGGDGGGGDGAVDGRITALIR